jgi:hypothetical protein
MGGGDHHHGHRHLSDSPLNLRLILESPMNGSPLGPPSEDSGIRPKLAANLRGAGEPRAGCGARGS